MVNDKDALETQFLNENPDMADFLNTSMICFVNGENSNLMGLFALFSNLFFFVFAASLTIILFIYIRTNRYGNMFKSTQQLQLMLFRAFSIQGGKLIPMVF
jgi:hypothetical protein